MIQGASVLSMCLMCLIVGTSRILQKVRHGSRGSLWRGSEARGHDTRPAPWSCLGMAERDDVDATAPPVIRAPAEILARLDESSQEPATDVAGCAREQHQLPIRHPRKSPGSGGGQTCEPPMR